jgi:cation diffusion facilitator CzcD-associated flavoprotein CzcO
MAVSAPPIEEDVVVIGAGSAGLSAALALRDRGIRALVLERSDAVGASWRSRYARLRLNSFRGTSHLPGRRFPDGTPAFPTREEFIAHLDEHSGDLDVRLGARAERIDRDGDAWRLRLADGEIRARQVVVATGYDHTPHIPDWPGRASFRGRLLHSAQYRDPEPFRDAAVLVAGAGTSGMEIAFHVARGGARQVSLAARTPPNIFLREGPGGVPGDVIALALLHAPVRFADAFSRFGRRQALGDLSAHGLPVPEEGVFARLRRLGVAPAIVDAEVIDAVRDGRITVVPGVRELDETGVRLEDGERVEADAVIAATGYRRGLEPLVGHLGVLDGRGVPRATAPEPAADGLRFVGYVPRPGMLGYAAKTAAQAAKAIAREL